MFQKRSKGFISVFLEAFRSSRAFQKVFQGHYRGFRERVIRYPEVQEVFHGIQRVSGPSQGIPECFKGVSGRF